MFCGPVLPTLAHKPDKTRHAAISLPADSCTNSIRASAIADPPAFWPVPLVDWDAFRALAS